MCQHDIDKEDNKFGDDSDRNFDGEDENKLEYRYGQRKY